MYGQLGRFGRTCAMLALVGGCAQSTGAVRAVRPFAAGVRSLPVTQLVKLLPGTSPEGVAGQYGWTHLGHLGLGIHRFSVAGAKLPERVRGTRWMEQEQPIDLAPSQGQSVFARDRSQGRSGELPDDPLWPVQHGWRLCGIEPTWRDVPGDATVVVAVVDSGIDAAHPDLSGQVVPGWDLTGPTGVAGGGEDPYGHGTHVAGVIAGKANNGVGIAGIAPGVRLMPVRIFNRFGHSTSGASTEAIIWAVDHGARIINASWGSTLQSQAMQDALRYALAHDVLVVAAVGNSGKNIPSYPGADEDALGVAASTDRDAWATFSSFGDWVDLAAPGEGIVSTYPTALGTGYRVMSGTSMAAPSVSAAAALVRSVHPEWPVSQVREALCATADDIVKTGVDPYAGYGRINVARALAYRPSRRPD